MRIGALGPFQRVARVTMVACCMWDLCPRIVYILSREVALPMMMIVIIDPVVLPLIAMAHRIWLGNVRLRCEVPGVDILSQCAVTMVVRSDSRRAILLALRLDSIIDPGRSFSLERQTIRTPKLELQILCRGHLARQILETDPTVVEVTGLVIVAVSSIIVAGVGVVDARVSTARVDVVVIIVEVVTVAGSQARRV